MNEPQGKPRDKRRTRIHPAARSARDLRAMFATGARQRRYRFFAGLKAMLVPLLVSSLLQGIVYAALFTRAQSWPARDLWVAVIILALGPFCVGLLLGALRRSRFPISAGFVTAAVVFNFAVVVLAALRVSVSYWGLLAAAAIAAIAAIVANLRLQRRAQNRVAILDFAEARHISALLGGRSDIIESPEAEVQETDLVLYDGASHHTRRWSPLLTKAHMQGAELLPWISYLEQRRGQVDVDQFDLSHLAYSPNQIFYSRVKRAVDLVLLVLSLPVVVPVGGLIWLYIKVRDPGSAFFVQTRRGYGGQNFRMLKFRTMYKGTHGGAAAEEDKRVIAGCAFLRRARLDELPQLINIWRGEMSWIGPRPESRELARRYEEEIPQYVYRLLTLPGITGWAQVNNGYTSTAREARLKLAFDLYYVKNISLDLDLEILVRTIRTLLTRHGAR